MIFYRTSISTIESGTWEGLSHLLTLRINYNQLTNVYARMFEHLSSLTELEMERNDISMIESGAWMGLNNLRNLSLSDNSLTTISSVTFENLFSLTNLWLGRNPISTLQPDTFKDLQSLEYLDFESEIEGFDFRIDTHYNELVSVQPNAFRGLKSLRKLNFGKLNKLVTLEQNIFDPEDFLATEGHPGDTLFPPYLVLECCKYKKSRQSSNVTTTSSCIRGTILAKKGPFVRMVPTYHKESYLPCSGHLPTSGDPYIPWTPHIPWGPYVFVFFQFPVG